MRVTEIVRRRALEQIGERRREGFDESRGQSWAGGWLDLGLPLEVERLLGATAFRVRGR